ncbi:MAG: hypothetical protein KDD55_07975, partial [Bdellovibrionales bacterium]|nr:hypothetical protein [Bdellovibrionales bacterium]
DPNTMLITEIPGRMKTSFVKPVEEPDDDPFSPQYDDQPPRHEKKSQPIFASEQVSAPSATPSQSHTQGETQFLELNMPPSEGFMRWVQVSLSGVPSVQEAYLVRKVGDGNTPVVYLGVGLQPGASFHEQREVLRVLSEQAANLPEADKANIILLNELNAGTIVDKGRLIFKK